MRKEAPAWLSSRGQKLFYWDIDVHFGVGAVGLETLVVELKVHLCLDFIVGVGYVLAVDEVVCLAQIIDAALVRKDQVLAGRNRAGYHAIRDGVDRANLATGHVGELIVLESVAYTEAEATGVPIGYFVGARVKT